MSMFERLGEKVERFKQEAVAAREDSADYRCRDCGEGFHSEPETCPECGSTEIERVTTETEESEEQAETDASPDEPVADETPADQEAGSADGKSVGESGDTGSDPDPDPDEIDAVIDEAEPDESDSSNGL